MNSGKIPFMDYLRENFEMDGLTQSLAGSAINYVARHAPDNHTMQEQLWEILDGSNLGIEKTEICACQIEYSDQGTRTIEIDMPKINEHSPLERKGICWLDLTIRSYNCLCRDGISTIGQLCRKTRSELLNIRGCGIVSLREIEERLAENGLSLKKE